MSIHIQNATNSAKKIIGKKNLIKKTAYSSKASIAKVIKDDIISMTRVMIFPDLTFIPISIPAASGSPCEPEAQILFEIQIENLKSGSENS